jgi:allantoinase
VGFPPELVAARPAARLRLPGKGRLEPGADADLVLVDMSVESELRADDLHYRHRHSPYVGMRMRGRIEATYLRGQRVDDAAPRGRLVRPAPPG